MTDLQQASLHPYANCPMGEGDCREFSAQPEIEVTDRGGQVAVFVCKRCGHGVTRPPIADVSSLYDGRESQDYQGQDGGLATAIKRMMFDRQARQILAQADFHAGRVVDFGCGSGLLTSSVSRMLPKDSHVIALDFFDQAPQLLDAESYRSFANSHDVQGTADMLTCFHVLEHDDDTAAFLQRITAFMKPGGTLVIEVPNIDCVWAGPFGKYWDNWYLPFHRVHFSRQSFRRVIERGGLDVMKELDVHVPSIGRSLARWLGVPNSLPFVLLSGLLMPLQWLGEKLTKRPSALRIIARKKG